jgi:hypothetical protein
MSQSERFTHAETQEYLKNNPISQKDAIRGTMQEFDARIEEIQSLCGDSLSKHSLARLKTMRTLISYEIGACDGD